MFREKLLSGGLLDTKNPEIPRLYPTTIRLPVWARPMTIRTAVSRLNISDFRVRQISPEFELERGLARSLFKPEFPLALSPATLMERLSGEAPIDGVEIVEWMQISAVENSVMQARMVEYNQLGS